MDILQKIFEKLLNEAICEAKQDLTRGDVEKPISDIVEHAVPDVAKVIIESLKERAAENLNLSRSENQEFVDGNINKWRAGFDSLEIFIAVCLEAGSEFNNLNKSQAFEEKNVIFEVVIRLHARACHISSDILWLLKGGFPDAAQARWRALHEVAVTALTILNHDNELATRFLDHEVVECYKGMNQYNKYEPRLNVERFTEEEIAVCKKDYDQALKKYGKNYKESYGWACDVLNNPRPNFSDLEKGIGLDHLRPYYKWASQNIHANVLSIRNQLGLLSTKKDLLLAGPSNSGLTDPAQLTSLSLAQISIGMLQIYPNFDSVVTQYIIDELSKEIGPLFWEIESAARS